MTDKRQIDLSCLFRDIYQTPYVLTHFQEFFPVFQEGSDIDFLCENEMKLSKDIVSFLRAHQNAENEIRMSFWDKGRVHIDFYFRNRLEIRFDIYSTLNIDKIVSTKDGFVSSIIENRRVTQIDDFFVQYPAIEDELVIRYIFFKVMSRRKPSKIRHYRYIEDRISEDVVRQKFFKRLRDNVAFADHRMSVRERLLSILRSSNRYKQIKHIVRNSPIYRPFVK